MQTVDVHAIAGAVRGLKERKALDVVPVRMADEQMHFEAALRILFGERNAQLADSGAAVEDEDIFAAADFHARGVAAVANRFGTWSCYRSTRAPELHAKDRTAQLDGVPHGIYELLLGIRLHYVLVGAEFLRSADVCRIALRRTNHDRDILKRGIPTNLLAEVVSVQIWNTDSDHHGPGPLCPQQLITGSIIRSAGNAHLGLRKGSLCNRTGLCVFLDQEGFNHSACFLESRDGILSQSLRTVNPLLEDWRGKLHGTAAFEQQGPDLLQKIALPDEVQSEASHRTLKILLLAGAAHHLLHCTADVLNVVLRQRRVNRECQARLAQLLRNRMPESRTPRCKRLFQVNLAAASREARHSLRVDGMQDRVSVPPFPKSFRPNENIKTVVRRFDVRTCRRNPQGRNLAKAAMQDVRQRAAPVQPPTRFLQLLASDRRLRFRHSPVRSDRAVNPAEAIALRGRSRTLRMGAVIAKRRGPLPEFGEICCQHSAFTDCCHDLVLAE